MTAARTGSPLIRATWAKSAGISPGWAAKSSTSARNTSITAAACAKAVGAGHTFYVILGPGTFPIHALDRIKACPEVCRVFCATGNPLQVLVARTPQGAGIVGVVDGSSPKGVEGEADKADRKSMLRRFGYKFA